jgi:hypothetical protein
LPKTVILSLLTDENCTRQDQQIVNLQRLNTPLLSTSTHLKRGAEGACSARNSTRCRLHLYRRSRLLLHQYPYTIASRNLDDAAEVAPPPCRRDDDARVASLTSQERLSIDSK